MDDSANPNPAIPVGTDARSLPAWLMRGAVREDDLAYLGGFWFGPNPKTDQDPPKAFWRVMNHFYDPTRNSPLTLTPLQNFTFATLTGDYNNFFAAPSWALGVMDAMNDPNTPFSSRHNHYTILDARETMYRALTGKRKDGSDEPTAKTEEGRKKYWATTFRALGDVVHLLQDMAQPQHTRNDPHSGAPGFGHKSLYEAYIECRATGGVNALTAEAGARSCQGLTYGGYPIPRFTKYSDFFSTQEGSSGRGLADYSNRGFFGAGTNLGSEKGKQYLLPPHDPNAYQKQPVALAAVSDGYYSTTTAPIHLLRYGVTDTVPGGQSAASVSLTTEGLWYQPLAELHSTNVAEAYGYALTRPNYDEAANLLIPRAVAYSAGLIDYFFRGRLEAEDAGYTDTGISLRVRNAIDAKKVPAWVNETLARNGNLTLAYEYKLPDPAVAGGMRTFVGSSQAVVMTEESDLKPGDTSQLLYSFTFDKIPKEAKEVKYRLVFRGKLGEESDAIAVGSVEPFSGFVVTPNYTPSDSLTGARHLYRAWGEWRLSDKTGLKAGNIDWKGWYTEGKPAKVLSWKGPRSRYFHDSGDPFSPEVYQNGEVFARAPVPVHGAALARDPQGKEWLIVIGRSEDYYGLIDVVYRRPNKKSDSVALYHPIDNPEGWQQIGRFNHGWSTIHAIDVPWFFNGAGTEAQTVRFGGASQLFRGRIKLGADLTSATFTDEPTPHATQTTTTQVTCAGDEGNESVTSYRRSVTVGGSYHVAVDYRESDPVFATYSLSTQDDRNRYWGARDVEETEGHYDASLQVAGAPALVFSSRSTKTARRYPDPAVSHDGHFASHRLHYLDLRHGLYAAYSTTSQQTATTGQYSSCDDSRVSGDIFCWFPMTRTLHAAQTVQIAATNLALTNYPAVTMSTDGGARFERSSSYVQYCNTTRSDTRSASEDYPKHLDRGTLRYAGSWAVDGNGNVLISQPLLDRNAALTGETYHFLTGGDLTQAIPGASAHPLYSVSGVIR